MFWNFVLAESGLSQAACLWSSSRHRYGSFEKAVVQDPFRLILQPHFVRTDKIKETNGTMLLNCINEIMIIHIYITHTDWLECVVLYEATCNNVNMVMMYHCMLFALFYKRNRPLLVYTAWCKLERSLEEFEKYIVVPPYSLKGGKTFKGYAFDYIVVFYLKLLFFLLQDLTRWTVFLFEEWLKLMSSLLTPN